MHFCAAPCVSMGREVVSVLLFGIWFVSDLTSQTRSTGFGHAQELETSAI